MTTTPTDEQELANKTGHWWTHKVRLDAYGNYKHFCNCGYTARGAEAIKGHVEWKKAELIQPNNPQPTPNITEKQE